MLSQRCELTFSVPFPISMALTQSSGLHDPSTAPARAMTDSDLAGLQWGWGTGTLAFPAVSILCALRTVFLDSPAANQADSHRQTQLCHQTLKGRYRLLGTAR